MLSFLLPQLSSQALTSIFIFVDDVLQISLIRLHPANNFKFNIFFLHGAFENEVNKLLKLQVFTWNISVSALAVFGMALTFGALVHLRPASALHALPSKLHALINSSFPLVIDHKVLFHQCLAILVIVKLLPFVNVGVGEEGVGVFFICTMSSWNALNHLIVGLFDVFPFNVEPANSHLEQLILPLSV